MVTWEFENPGLGGGDPIDFLSNAFILHILQVRFSAMMGKLKQIEFHFF